MYFEAGIYSTWCCLYQMTFLRLKRQRQRVVWRRCVPCLKAGIHGKLHQILRCLKRITECLKVFKNYSNFASRYKSGGYAFDSENSTGRTNLDPGLCSVMQCMPLYHIWLLGMFFIFFYPSNSEASTKLLICIEPVWPLRMVPSSGNVSPAFPTIQVSRSRLLSS